MYDDGLSNAHLRTYGTPSLGERGRPKVPETLVQPPRAQIAQKTIEPQVVVQNQELLAFLFLFLVDSQNIDGYLTFFNFHIKVIATFG
jgi:hypothetical protein